MEIIRFDYSAATFALCVNPECMHVHEFTVLNDVPHPVFCSKCKHPLITNCIHCGLPFTYRPHLYCGCCSGPLEGSLLQGFVRTLAALLRFPELIPDMKKEIPQQIESTLRGERSVPLLSVLGDQGPDESLRFRDLAAYLTPSRDDMLPDADIAKKISLSLVKS